MDDATITVRTARPGDLAALDTLFAASYPRLLRPDYPPSVMVLALPRLARAQPALLASGSYYVAEAADGALIGAGGFSPRRGGAAEVRHVVTDHRRLRQGVASAVFDRIFAAARARGIVRLDCSATRTAVPFYRAMGFSLLGPIEMPLAPGITFPAIRMLRRL